jgi:adenine-specific DNA-methyltransferase
MEIQFEKAADKLDGWVEDFKLVLEREIKDFDKQIKETRRLPVAALTLEEKLRHQKEIKRLESSRKSLFDAQDDIDRRRDNLIKGIDTNLKVRYTRKTLFEVQWGVKLEGAIQIWAHSRLRREPGFPGLRYRSGPCVGGGVGKNL